MFFAGFEVRDCTSVRRIKDGETTDDLFASLTTEPNAEVGAIHPKACDPDADRGLGNLADGSLRYS